jgi:hypothetical protein
MRTPVNRKVLDQMGRRARMITERRKRIRVKLRSKKWPST